MKWKQVMVVVSLLGASGNILAQGTNTPITIKPAKKQSLEAVNKLPDVTAKAGIHKSLNPDRLDFIGIPSAIKASK